MTLTDQTAGSPAPASMTDAGDLVTARLQQQIDDAAARGGGRVVVGAGVHRTGALRLRSGIELHLEAGSVLQFVPDPALYPTVDARWEGVTGPVHSPCLYAQGEENVAITGLGTIDGGGASWWARRDDLELPRPTLVGLHGCRRVVVRDVVLRNSPAWTVHPALCEDVSVTGLRIHNPADSPNTDGIDPESCRGVRISDCYIDVGDDCIAIKAGTERTRERMACENITITNCTMVRGHGGVVVGSEMAGGVRNVVISSCVFRGTDRGIRIKTRRGRGGVVENVRVSGIVMEDVLSPLTINSFYHCGTEGKLPHVGDRRARSIDESTPQIRGLHLAHITATGVRASAAHLFGLPEAPLRDISLEDVSVTFAEDPVPGVPEMAEGVGPVAAEGMRLGFVHDSRLSGVRVLGAHGEELMLEECERISVESVGR